MMRKMYIAGFILRNPEESNWCWPFLHTSLVLLSHLVPLSIYPPVSIISSCSIFIHNSLVLLSHLVPCLPCSTIPSCSIYLLCSICNLNLFQIPVYPPVPYIPWYLILFYIYPPVPYLKCSIIPSCSIFMPCSISSLL